MTRIWSAVAWAASVSHDSLPLIRLNVSLSSHRGRGYAVQAREHCRVCCRWVCHFAQLPLGLPFAFLSSHTGNIR